MGFSYGPVTEAAHFLQFSFWYFSYNAILDASCVLQSTRKEQDFALILVLLVAVIIH